MFKPQNIRFTKGTKQLLGRGPDTLFPLSKTVGVAVVLTLLGLLTGCDGFIGDPGTGDTAPVPKIDADNPVPPPEMPPASAEAPVARLTDLELRNTLFALFGKAASDLVGNVGAFAGASLESVDAVESLARFQLAESVAALVHQQPGVVTCDPSDRSGCTRQIIREQGLRILRRPISDVRLERYAAAAASQESFDDGIYVVLAAFLTSPEFLYRIERGDAARRHGRFLALDDFEMASRLSYALWRTMPDQELFDAASAGRLSSREDVQSQVRRMLGDEKARSVLTDFHREWLRLEDGRTVLREAEDYPDFDDNDPELWIAETERFVDHAVFEGQGTLFELFTASFGMPDARLGETYGVSASDGRTPTELPAGERAGLLTQAAIVGGHAPEDRLAPIYRGAFVFRKLLCGELSDPPADIPPLPTADPDSSLRQQVETLTTSGEPCRSCHVQFNPYGFAFERYDANGRFTDIDVNGKPVDDAVTLVGPGDLEGVEVHGAIELANEIAQSAALRDCYVDQWFRYLSGRNVDIRSGDGYSRALSQYEFEVSDRNVQELLVSLLSSDAFRYVVAHE